MPKHHVLYEAGLFALLALALVGQALAEALLDPLSTVSVQVVGGLGALAAVPAFAVLFARYTGALFEPFTGRRQASEGSLLPWLVFFPGMVLLEAALIMYCSISGSAAIMIYVAISTAMLVPGIVVFAKCVRG